MRKSTRGSARGSGRGISPGDRILARSTMTARSVGGFCASIAMGSAGAATMQLAAPQARKLALSPGGERPPKSLIALASATSSPLRFKPARTDLALSSAVDNVRRMPSAVCRPVRGDANQRRNLYPQRVEYGQLASLPARGIDHSQPVARLQVNDDGSSTGYTVALERRADARETRFQKSWSLRCNRGHISL